MLLQLRRPKDAAQEFQRALARAPRRTRSLLGLARAEKASGDAATSKKTYATINPQWYVPVNDGLRQVVESGTAIESKIDGISLCGKTGTVQNSHGDHHSVFAGFAPKDHPRIAIAVVVENAGFGATFGCPIASLMVEKYINDTIADNRLAKQQKMEETNLLGKYALGTKMAITNGHH